MVSSAQGRLQSPGQSTNNTATLSQFPRFFTRFFYSHFSASFFRVLFWVLHRAKACLDRKFVAWEIELFTGCWGKMCIPKQRADIGLQTYVIGVLFMYTNRFITKYNRIMIHALYKFEIL